MLLQEPGDCSAPCFWGITPGITSIEEARRILNHLDLSIWEITNAGKESSGIQYRLDSGLSFYANLSVKNNTVDRVKVIILPEERVPGVKRGWFAYSPEALIERYGVPSRVDILARFGPNDAYWMKMYFDAVDLIVEYGVVFSPPSKAGIHEICPATDQFESVVLWMGNNSLYPPAKGVVLENATGLSVDEFSRSMLEDPGKACFTVRSEPFQ
jgi:hypothetical protein